MSESIQVEGVSVRWCKYLLVEHHVHAVRPHILCELAQEGEDVLDARRVGQPPQPQAVPRSTWRGQERH